MSNAPIPGWGWVGGGWGFDIHSSNILFLHEIKNKLVSASLWEGGGGVVVGHAIDRCINGTCAHAQILRRMAGVSSSPLMCRRLLKVE